jgi:hypothetical protein
MLTMRELAPVAGDDSTERLITVIGQDAHGLDHTIARYRTAACYFEDKVNFFPVLGQYEVWQLINLTVDTRPIHIHLNPFHVLARYPVIVTVPEDGISDTATAATVRHGRGADDHLDPRSGRCGARGLRRLSARLRVAFESPKVENHAALVAEDPRVVPGRHVEGVAGSELPLAAVVHSQRHAPL